MKFLNDFKNIFAILGVVSLIFWTCASESTSDDSSSNLPPQLTGGTYQVSTFGTNGMVALNTETGVMKTYSRDINDWYDYSDMSTPAGVDGNLVFTH